MTKKSTTIRLDNDLYKKAAKEAEKRGMNFSVVVQLLLKAFAEGEVEVGIMQYPKAYLEKLEKTAKQAREDVRKGAKTYTSAKDMMDDILKE